MISAALIGDPLQLAMAPSGGALELAASIMVVHKLQDGPESTGGGTGAPIGDV
jgi:hypothetical protein